MCKWVPGWQCVWVLGWGITFWHLEMGWGIGVLFSLIPFYLEGYRE